MARVVFKPWRGGKCEIHLVKRHSRWCDKRARWYITTNGYVLCGEHKRLVEHG